MRKQKLTYRFHDPNPPGVAAEHILKVLIEANTPKAEKAIREAMAEMERQSTEAVNLNNPETLEWEEQDEAEEMEQEECPSRGWAMTMM